MARLFCTLLGGAVCGLGVALTFGTVLLLFGPDLPTLLEDF